MRQVLLSVALVGLACARPPARAEVPEAPTRLSILAPGYGASPAHPGALQPGDALQTLALPLADGGSFELADALLAGPVVLIWIGAAEHQALTDWIAMLDRSLAQLEQRGATLLFVRSLAPEATLRWATELGLQTPVAGDPDDALERMLELSAGPLEFAVLIVAEGTVVYRKLGGRRPELDELLAVLDGAGERLRCCPGACEGLPCE